MLGLFFLYYHTGPRDLPSFPTRRSSDLLHERLFWRAIRFTRLDSTRRRGILFSPGVDIVRIIRGSLERSRNRDRKSTRLNSSHSQISYAVFCLKKKKKK